MSDYAAAGLVAIATPQANTTVEAELSVLLAPNIGLVTTRLHSPLPDARARLVDYLERLAPALDTLDNAPVAAAGFACTGTAYLVEPARWQATFEALASQRGYPVWSASQAIRAALVALEARRIAMLSPYPAWLREACEAYVATWGIEIVQAAALPGDRNDTRRIYAIRGRDIAEGLAAMHVQDMDAVDAVLVSGTGAPTLGPIAAHRSAAPLLSSTLCLAWALEQTVLGQPLDRASLLAKVADTGWRERFAKRFPEALLAP
ncbi:MAG: hypothetical protein ABIO45_07440 [Burkholderiaceae bacterium]